MSTAALLSHIDRDTRRQDRAADGSLMARRLPARDARICHWGGAIRHAFAIKPAGLAIRGNDADREAEEPETAPPEVQASPVPRIRPAARVAAQPRQSSFVAAAAVALIDFAGVRS